jgi:lysophospholipase L1-like esterase
MKKKVFLIIAIVLAVALIAGVVYYFAVIVPEQKQQEEFQKMLDQYYADKLALYRQENEQYADYEVDVAFLGDSLTDGYDVAKYYPQFKTANRGIGGDTTHGLEARLQVSVYDLKPKVAVMLIGANNPETMFENYASILMGLQENLPDTKIVLVSMTSMSREWGRKNHLAAYNNVLIRKLADKYGFTFVDMYAPLLDLTTGELRDSYTTDGGHLTHEGYVVFTETLTPVLEELLSMND